MAIVMMGELYSIKLGSNSSFLKVKNVLKCSKNIQITQIDCENILGFKKILKQIIGANRINSKGKKKDEKKHKSTKIYMVRNNFMSKFHSNKFGRMCR